jgi:hypothetical protein
MCGSTLCGAGAKRHPVPLSIEAFALHLAFSIYKDINKGIAAARASIASRRTQHHRASSVVAST